MQNMKNRTGAESAPYKAGDIVEFRLKAEHPQNVELIDKWGYTAYVTGLNGRLKKGQAVECRITSFKGCRPQVVPVGLVNESGSRWSVTKEDVLSLMSGENTLLSGFVSLLLSEPSAEGFELAVHKWITHLAQQKAALESLRRAVSDLLEDTDFLFRCQPDERRCFTERITLVIELVGYYIKADGLLQQASEEDDASQRFVEDVFRKLSTSGYIYHPRKNIYMLICLFTLRPSLMQTNIRQLFGIIRKREVADWQQESYCRLLVKVLELYVELADAAMDRLLDQTAAVQDILQALSLIILLGSSEDDGSAPLVARSRLLRYASYLNHTQQKRLVDMAWSCLTGRADKPAYALAATADSGLLAAMLANNTLRTGGMADSALTFTQRGVRFSISPDGRMVFRPVEVGKGGRPVLPAGLLPWHGMQVVLADGLKTAVTGGCDDIFRFTQLWKEIELGLFYPGAEKRGMTLPKRKAVAEPGDRVNIYITHKDENDKFLFHCRMAGSEEGKGTVSVYPDMVGYKPNAGIESFLSQKGRPLILPAVIKEVDEQGNYVFSCRELVTQMQTDYADYNMHMVCSIGSYSTELNRYSAVTKEGFSISIPYEPPMPRLQTYQLVEVTGISPMSATGYYLDGGFVRLREDEVFDIQDAFHELVLNLSGGAEYVDLSVEEPQKAADDGSREMSAAQMLELMKLVDRQAVYETDYIRSYNYLAVARLLAALLGNEERIRFYQGRMDLLVMLHDFAVNDRVDEEKLLQLEKDNGELFRNNVQMYRRFYQLKLVGSIGRPDKNGGLMDTCRFDSDPGLRDLSSLVLAHNLLHEQGLLSQASSVHAYIKQQLHLKSRDTSLHHYGAEGTVSEFKTSLVYPAGGMTANLPVQTQVVMRVVAGMLNSCGGTVCLGVNDSGYGVGLEEDLRYAEFSGDRDRYVRYITDAVRERFGNTVMPYVSVAFDTANPLPVCMVRVSPYEKGVTLDGKRPVRQNSQTVDFSEEEFLQVRAQLRRNAATQVAGPVPAAAVPVAEELPDRTRGGKAVRQIPTAVYRYRAMDTESRYDRLGYVNLKENGVYSFSDTLMGGTLLSQPVFPEDDVLVLVHADGHINCVPVDDLTDKTPYRDYIGVKGAEIVFAALAGADDFVYLHYNVKNRPYVRVMPLRECEPMTMSVKGFPFTADEVSRFIEAEIIPGEAASRLKLNRCGQGNGYSAEHKDGRYLMKTVHKVLEA